MKDSSWLIPWMEFIRKHAENNLLLELGCGEGLDSRVLSDHGFNVIPLDINFESLAECSEIEGCFPVQADVSARLPFPDSSFGIVLASLCLHYFDWATTLQIIADVRRVLTSTGMLLLRVNSIEDVNFGAGKGIELEQDYYLNGTRTKRFFDRPAVESILKDMHIQSLEHQTIDRYGKDKQVWVAHAEA